MLQALRDHPMTLSDGSKLNLTASCGLAWVGPLDSLEHAVARADNALYAAKAEGRDRWKWADPVHVSLERPRIQSRMSNLISQDAPDGEYSQLNEKYRRLNCE
jgi:predicted signal transduction protein with EAL and GGDEF domain